MNFTAPNSASARVSSENAPEKGLGSDERHSVASQYAQSTVDAAQSVAANNAESLAASAVWSEMGPERLSEWNNLLLGSGASLYQYPLWNEPQRPLWLRPRYLVLEDREHLLAYVCILTIGFGPAKIGLVSVRCKYSPATAESYPSATFSPM